MSVIIYYVFIIVIYLFFTAKIFGVRHLQAFLMFLGLTVAYALRVDLSVGIVAMTNQTSTGVDFPVSIISKYKSSFRLQLTNF